MNDLAREARLWVQKWRWYERNTLPWNRARIHWELMRRGAFARWPMQGNVLEALREGRLEVGEGVLLEPNVWITAPGSARVRIGAGTFLNQGVMVASQELVEIGEHCMLANGCFVSDASHRYEDPDTRSPGRASPRRAPRGSAPTAGSARTWSSPAVLSVGERCVIGAGSVVTQDISPFSVAAGAPARVLKSVDHR